MPVKRFDVGSWLDSPMSRRRLDLSQFAEQRAAVQEICARVASDGDAALRELGMRFDGWAPAVGDDFAVPEQDVRSAARRLPAADRAALEFAAERIREFHAGQVAQPGGGPPGLKLLTRPVKRAGVYAPGGRAAYPSTVLMTAIPARVAGVSEVVLATPPRADGTVPTSILAAAHIAGVDRNPEQRCLAGARWQQPRQHLHRRGLAATVRSDEAENLAALNREAHMIYGRELPKAAREVLRNDHGLAVIDNPRRNLQGAMAELLLSRQQRDKCLFNGSRARLLL